METIYSLPSRRQPLPDRDDMLWGVTAIADFIGLPAARTFDLLDRGLIPARTICNGTIWIGRRSRLAELLGRR